MSALPRQQRLYGRHKGPRLSKRRQQLLEMMLPNLRISLPDEAESLDPESLFDFTPRQIWLEVGFGKGEHLAHQAEKHPDIGFLGCEFFINGVAALLAGVEERALTNIRIHDHDARDLINALQPNSIDRFFLLHPDPWPKKRHAGRRILQQTFLDDIARILKPGAELRIGTDHPVYQRWAALQMSVRTDFEWMAETSQDWWEKPEDWPDTRYEEKGTREGRPPAYFIYRVCGG